jgi:hypothetical protein
MFDRHFNVVARDVRNPAWPPALNWYRLEIVPEAHADLFFAEVEELGLA